MVEGQNMDLKERAPLFDGQEPIHAPRELVRRDDDGDRAERIIPLERVDFRNEGVFKIGVERAGDDREHDRRSLAEKWRRNNLQAFPLPRRERVRGRGNPM